MDFYRFELSSGEVVVGAVQGNGGVLREEVRGPARLLQSQQRVSEGRALAIYEPAPGCVAVMPDYSAQEDGRRVVVSLAGARISLESR